MARSALRMGRGKMPAHRKKVKKKNRWDEDDYFAPIYSESRKARLPMKEIIWALVSGLIVLAVLERDDFFQWFHRRDKETTRESRTVQPPSRQVRDGISLFDDSRLLPLESDLPPSQGDRIEGDPLLKESIPPFADSEKVGVEGLERLLHYLWDPLINYEDIADSEKLLAKVLSDVTYTARDVEIFVNKKAAAFRKKRRFPEIFGFFVSALVNQLSEPSDLTFSLDHALDYVGYKNGRKAGHKITVNGDVGYHAANRMGDGVLIVNGDGQLVANEMRGGKVEINGNVKSLAETMEGGSVLVRGDAEVVAFKLMGGRVEVLGDVYSEVASHMMGGEVVVRGNARSVAYMLTGGMVVVEKEVLRDAGTKMKDGVVCIFGNAGLGFKKYYVSTLQEGGRIDVYGCVAGVGARSKGGEIHVHGCVPEIMDACRASVYHQHRLLNPQLPKEEARSLPLLGEDLRR